MTTMFGVRSLAETQCVPFIVSVLQSGVVRQRRTYMSLPNNSGQRKETKALEGACLRARGCPPHQTLKLPSFISL